LVAIVEMTTDEAAQPSIAISDGMDTTTVTFPDANTEHSLPVLGMMPNTPYTVT
jgi:hypothetical protein